MTALNFFLEAMALAIAGVSFTYFLRITKPVKSKVIDIYSILNKAPSGGADEAGYDLPPRISERVWAVLGKALVASERNCPAYAQNDQIIVLRFKAPSIHRFYSRYPKYRSSLASVMENTLRETMKFLQADLGFAHGGELTFLIPCRADGRQAWSGSRDALIARGASFIGANLNHTFFNDVELDIALRDFTLDGSVSFHGCRKEAFKFLLHRGYTALVYGLNMEVPPSVRVQAAFKRYQWLRAQNKRPAGDYSCYGLLIERKRVNCQAKNVRTGEEHSKEKNEYVKFTGNLLNKWFRFV